MKILRIIILILLMTSNLLANSNYFKELYHNHIITFNNCWEHPGTKTNIDDFYKDVAIIFLRLYATFPRKTILYVDEVCGADEPDEFGLHSERFLSGFSAMVWLAEHD